MYGVIGVRRPLPEIDKPRVHKKKRARYYGVHSFIIKTLHSQNFHALLLPIHLCQSGWPAAKYVSISRPLEAIRFSW